MSLSEKKPVTGAHTVHGSRLYEVRLQEMSRIGKSTDTEVDEWLPLAGSGGRELGVATGGYGVSFQVMKM